MHAMNFVARAISACPTWANHALAYTLYLLAYALIPMILGAISMPLQAQSTRQDPLSAYQHSVDCGSATLMEGDTVWVWFNLGTQSAIADSILGVSIEFKHIDATVAPGNLQVNRTGSWLFDDQYFSLDTDVDETDRIVLIEMHRTNGVSRDGHGFIFKFPLICTEDNVAAGDVIQQIDGVVTVENVEMRVAAAQSDATPMPIASSSFPNPTSGRLTVPCELPWQTSLRLIGSDGKIYNPPVERGGGMLQTDLAELAPGIYVLELSLAGQVQRRERIVLR